MPACGEPADRAASGWRNLATALLTLGLFVGAGAAGIPAVAQTAALSIPIVLPPEKLSWHGDSAAPDISGVWVRVDSAAAAGVRKEGWLPWAPPLKPAFAKIWHDRVAMQAAGYSVEPQGMTRAREAVLLGRAHGIAAIQPEEAAIISAMCPEAHVFTTPMPALPCPPPPEIRRIPGRLVFVGSAGLPNLDGLRWFLAEIWPLLDGHGITLDVIGDCGAALRRLPKGVQAKGRVTDLATYLHRASLAIAPLRAGSGLKVKLLDYARHGLTTIVTPPALAGFEADGNSPFIVAGSAVMFAEAVRRLANDPPQPNEALAYCGRNYGLRSSFAGLVEALQAETGQKTRPRFGAVGPDGVT